MEMMSADVIRALAKELVDPYLPLVDEALDKYAPVLDKIFSRMNSYMREKNVENIKFYEKEGLSHKEAILLCINAQASIQKALNACLLPLGVTTVCDA